MALKLRDTNNSGKVVYEYVYINTTVPNPPQGLPVGFPTFSYVGNKPISIPSTPAMEMSEAKSPMALNYYADYGGCGHWRMIWPEFVLNSSHKVIITGGTKMIFDINYYNDLSCIRFQRQATTTQKDFAKALIRYRNDKNSDMRFVYDVDDIVFNEDIPEYNRCRESFVDKEIVENITEFMGMVDEITVTCDFMKEYYQEKTGNKKITVIPNYPPKFWLDRFYDKDKVLRNFEKNKKRPRILYAGSGTHVDILNKTGLQDDFAQVVNEIIKSRKKFQYIFKGCYPLALRPYIDNGEIEYVEWSPLFDLPQNLFNIGANAVFAPLQDNIFNKSKSNIKMIESGALGLPGAFQDICTYKEAEFKFQNGADLISQLETITKDEGFYMKQSQKARKFVEGLWLEDEKNIKKFEAIYTTPWGSKERNMLSPELIALNPDQKI